MRVPVGGAATAVGLLLRGLHVKFTSAIYSKPLERLLAFKFQPRSAQGKELWQIGGLDNTHTHRDTWENRGPRSSRMRLAYAKHPI